MKTAKQIAAEVEKLKVMKPTVLRTSAFGDNHHDAIEFQVRVLENDLEDSDIYDEFDDDGLEQNVADAGLEATQWRDGDEPAPSESWKELVR